MNLATATNAEANLALRAWQNADRPSSWTFGNDDLPVIADTDDEQVIESKMHHQNDDGDSLASLGVARPEMEIAA